jgi:hypothetical protein
VIHCSGSVPSAPWVMTDKKKQGVVKEEQVEGEVEEEEG